MSTSIDERIRPAHVFDHGTETRPLLAHPHPPVDPHAPLVWCDIETTGLEVEWDQILEVAMVITDSDLEIQATYTSVVHWPELVSMKQIVREMHLATGLYDEVYREGKLLPEIERDLISLMLRNGVNEKSPMAGSTVHFDRAFMRRDLPGVVNMLHHRIIDVSTLKELVRRWSPGNEWVKGDRHRALPDILDSIRELNHYRKLFGMEA